MYFKSIIQVIELMELYVYMDFAPLLSICWKYLQDLSIEGETFTPSDVERVLWSCAVGAKLSSQKVPDPKSDTSKNSKRKRKR